jgi:hypothetical protein
VIWSATTNLPANVPMVDVLGLLPRFLDDDDPRPAKEQIAEYYIGGWRPLKGFTLDRETKALTYSGDPPMLPLVEAKLRDEAIIVYRYGWTLIGQPDGSFEVARLD